MKNYELHVRNIEKTAVSGRPQDQADGFPQRRSIKAFQSTQDYQKNYIRSQFSLLRLKGSIQP